MPLYGRIPLSLIGEPEACGDAPAAPWQFRGVLYQEFAFEVSAAEAMACLPEVFALTTPPYGKIQIGRYADTPIGPYTEALLLLGCRLNLAPHLYVVASVVSSERARAANSRNWQYTSAVGAVSLEQTDASITGIVETPSGSTIRVTSPATPEVSTSVVRYDPLVVGGADSDHPVLSEISVDANVSHAWLARRSTIEYFGGGAHDAWRRLRSCNPITCTIAEHEMVRSEPIAIPTSAVGGAVSSG